MLYADPDAAGRGRAQLGLDVPLATSRAPRKRAAAFAEALPVLPVGRQQADAAIVAAIERGAEAVAGGAAPGAGDEPDHQALAGLWPNLPYPGHTEFLAELAVRYCGGPRPRPVMMLAAEELKVVPATVHIPLTAVAAALTAALLRRDDPHHGRRARARFRHRPSRASPSPGSTRMPAKAARSGARRCELIAPGVAGAARRGAGRDRPAPPTRCSMPRRARAYDAASCMYHDQALIPLKTLAFDRGVNVTLGLPFVRTSPDHGTAFAIAGTGKARPDSLIAALRLAARARPRRAETRRSGRMHEPRAAAQPRRPAAAARGDPRATALRAKQGARPEFHPRPQPDAAHRARRRAARGRAR